MALAFDLQSHSTCSDGTLSPAEVVALAARAGVELLALSDHDTVAGVSEAIASGKSAGVGVVPAVEISSIDPPAEAAAGGDGRHDSSSATAAAASSTTNTDTSSRPARELHILGYGIDHTGPPLTDRLGEFLADREQRTLRMRDALREVGFELEEAEIEQRIAEGKPIGRPHLAGQRAAPAR